MTTKIVFAQGDEKILESVRGKPSLSRDERLADTYGRGAHVQDAPKGFIVYYDSLSARDLNINPAIFTSAEGASHTGEELHLPQVKSIIHSTRPERLG